MRLRVESVRILAVDVEYELGGRLSVGRRSGKEVGLAESAWLRD